jgi:hypothetical protein
VSNSGGSDPDDRFRHEALIYGSDQELLEFAVPFLDDGVRSGSATVLRVPSRLRALILDALDDAADVMIVPMESFESPMRAVRATRSLVEDLANRDGDGRVRVLGAVPRDPWSGWVRYEAALNHVMGPLSAWGVCPYDARETADDVLADVQRTHPRLSGLDRGRTVGYRDPAGFLAEQAERDSDPLVTRPPDVELLDPDPEQLGIIELMAQRTQLGRDDVDGLRLSTIEVMRNAADYGLRPICVRVWAAIDRLIVAVTDRGPGLWDPFVGLITNGADDVGHGLERVYDAVSDVVPFANADGFTIRLTQRAGAVA